MSYTRQTILLPIRDQALAIPSLYIPDLLRPKGFLPQALTLLFVVLSENLRTVRSITSDSDPTPRRIASPEYLRLKRTAGRDTLGFLRPLYTSGNQPIPQDITQPAVASLQLIAEHMDISRPYTNPHRYKPSVVCSQCLKRKLKCDRQQPCGRCVADGVATLCAYEPHAVRLLQRIKAVERQQWYLQKELEEVLLQEGLELAQHRGGNEKYLQSLATSYPSLASMSSYPQQARTHPPPDSFRSPSLFPPINTPAPVESAASAPLYSVSPSPGPQGSFDSAATDGLYNACSDEGYSDNAYSDGGHGYSGHHLPSNAGVSDSRRDLPPPPSRLPWFLPPLHDLSDAGRVSTRGTDPTSSAPNSPTPPFRSSSLASPCDPSSSPAASSSSSDDMSDVDESDDAEADWEVVLTPFCSSFAYELSHAPSAAAPSFSHTTVMNNAGPAYNSSTPSSFSSLARALDVPTTVMNNTGAGASHSSIPPAWVADAGVPAKRRWAQGGRGA
ncbi:hypothetical protein DFH06DRAFT_1331396 [Mycena polygramma]|nr:hypothetical protein DFH06DRAFT_1331396 [Mycena polygramma]